MQKTVKREGVSAPKPCGREVRLGPHHCPSEVLVKRPEKGKKRLGPPTAPRHPTEEKDVATSTRLLVTLRHHRRLGDAPTYKTHQGNSERVEKREEWGRRGKGAHQQGVRSREWRGKGSSRSFKKKADASWAHAGGPLEKGADCCGNTGGNRS